MKHVKAQSKPRLAMAKSDPCAGLSGKQLKKCRKEHS